MNIEIDANDLQEIIKELELTQKQVHSAMKKTIKQASSMALEYVKQPNIGFKTSYRDTKKIPLEETDTSVSSGIENTSDAFYYFEYGTGTGKSEGAKNGEWYVPVDKADLSKYYPTTPNGKYYVVKPQRAQHLFAETGDLIERELEPLLEANLKKEIKE